MWNWHLRTPPGKYQATYKGKYLGLFSAISQAKTAIEQAKSKPAEQLADSDTTDSDTKPQKPKFKGVVRMKRGDYQIQIYDKKSGTMKYVKRTSDPTAIPGLMKKVKSKQDNQIIKRSNTDLYSKECMIKRFGLCMRIYTNDDGSLAVPSDLGAAVHDMKCCPLLSVCCPALYYMSLLGKDGPWKEVLSKYWSEAFDQTAESSAVAVPLRIRSLQLVEPCDLTNEDLMVMVRILQRSALAAWEEDREEWDDNVNKNKLYFSGWQRMVIHIYIYYVYTC